MTKGHNQLAMSLYAREGHRVLNVAVLVGLSHRDALYVLHRCHGRTSARRGSGVLSVPFHWFGRFITAKNRLPVAGVKSNMVTSSHPSSPYPFRIASRLALDDGDVNRASSLSQTVLYDHFLILCLLESYTILAVSELEAVFALIRLLYASTIRPRGLIQTRGMNIG